MLNKVQLIGRLGQDPEIKRLDSGVAVARLNLATSEKWKDKDGNVQEATEWHNIQAWRGLAEVAEKYMHKGDLIYVEGKITTRKWQTENGENRYSTEIVANNITMLSGKRDGASSATPPMPSENDAPPMREKNNTNGDAPPQSGTGDDLPF